MKRLRRLVGHWLDVVLGPRCVCGERVFSADERTHFDMEHAGD